jgi:predicted MFS family arabinose efflux permease
MEPERQTLGSLVSIISIVVAAGGIPVALLADRVSRVNTSL